MKTLLLNEKGEFTTKGAINHILLASEYFKFHISREGQTSPYVGNNVRVKLIVTCIKDVPNFDVLIFNSSSHSDCRKAGGDYEKYFNAPRWNEAFGLALQYVDEEVTKLDKLIDERLKALINAEF